MIYDAIIIGGGPSGMAAAVAAYERGLKQVCIIEREEYLGGVLPQCVHDGFGLHLFQQSYTGPEYARIWRKRVHDLGVEVFLQTAVLAISKSEKGTYLLEAVGIALGGHSLLEAQSLIVATGCRERARGQLNIPGTRPAGVLTAGTAQYMINIKNQLPGDSVVILGSGDIGLIMARRLTLEGAEVKMVLGQEATGLLRNHISCIKDFDIPIRYGWGVVSLVGKGQLYGVNIAPLDEQGTFDLKRKTLIRCNVLLIACGLIPEREVLEGIDLACDGIFICGNAREPVDLVDQVTKEGISCGSSCAEYVAQTHGVSVSETLPDDLAAIASTIIEEPKGSVAELMHGGSTTSDVEGLSLVVCTLCPTGCVLRIDESERVEGQLCKRGREYALAEAKRPLRVFTGTVLTDDGHLLPVRSAEKVPKELLVKIAKACRRITVPSRNSTSRVVNISVEGIQVDLITAHYQ